jgi:hypothetical protein
MLVLTCWMINSFATLKNEMAYKFGVHVPRNTKEFIKLDTENGNSLWAESIKTEFKQINDHG